MTQIENNVPIPENYSGSKWPFRELEKGQSFVFPYDKLNSISSNARTFGNAQSPKRKFIVKKISTTEARIWRIE